MIMSKTISVSQIKEAAQEAYEQFKDNTVARMLITSLIWLILTRTCSVSVSACWMAEPLR